MHTLLAYESSITNGSTYAQVNGIPDQSMYMDSSNRFVMPGPWQILAAYAAGVNLTAARMNAPSLRSLLLPEIYPANAAATPGNPDTPTVYGQGGPKLVMNEGLEVDVSRGGASAQPCWAGIWVAPQFIPAPQGKIFTITATSTITAAVGTWAFGSLSFTQTLPAGKYAVVGMAAVAANTFFCRLVFPGFGNLRPGVLVQPAFGQSPLYDYFRYGKMGLFGEFMNTALPSIEVAGDAGGAAAPTVYLDLIKTG